MQELLAERRLGALVRERYPEVQGTQLQSKREMRIASLFKDAPAALPRMIVVHGLAHLRESEHDKAFYALCTHMEPDYAQLQFDTRLWLTAWEIEG